jgi:hypothetical protein
MIAFIHELPVMQGIPVIRIKVKGSGRGRPLYVRLVRRRGQVDFVEIAVRPFCGASGTEHEHVAFGFEDDAGGKDVPDIFGDDAGSFLQLTDMEQSLPAASRGVFTQNG